MKKIYFKGYYGHRNLGDDIFTVTAGWLCGGLWKKYVPIFIGRHLPQMANRAKKVDVKNGILRRLYELIICIRVNNIIYFGGSLFSNGGNNIKDIKYLFKKIPFLGKKLGTIGTSIGPFDNENNYNSTKQLLQKFKFISVRDYSSIQELDTMGFKGKSSFCFDIAILIKDVFPNLRQVKKNKGKLKVAISLCHYERYKGQDTFKEKERELAMKQLLEDIVNLNHNIEEFIFIEFNGNPINGDTHITKEFHDYFSDRIKTKIIRYSSHTEYMVKEINNADFMIGMRLHSGIIAYALEIPFMLVEYHPKCTEFLNTINHNYRIDVNDFSSNFDNFNTLVKTRSVPNIVKPEYFKNIMINQLKNIEKLL